MQNSCLVLVRIIIVLCQGVVAGRGHGGGYCNAGTVELFDVTDCYTGVGLVFSFCVISSNKLTGLEQDRFVNTASVGQESRHGLAR